MFEFLKRKKAERSKYQVDSENLAVPEVHIQEEDRKEAADADSDVKDSAKDSSDSPITVDSEDVAIPEIHIHRK